MASSVSWVNLGLILVLFVFINVILLRENFVGSSFSETLLSMITLDPGSPLSQKCNLGPGSTAAPATLPSPSTDFPEEDILTPAPAAIIPGSPAVLPPSPPAVICPSSVPITPAVAPATTQCASDGLVDSIKRTIKADINEAISQLKMQELQKPPQIITVPATAPRTACSDQGLDYNAVKDDTCGMLIHPPFDPNEYIRKDEIPCWGCNLTD